MSGKKLERGLIPLDIFFLVLLIVISCGSPPKVSHSMIASETAKIQVWKTTLGVVRESDDSNPGLTRLNNEFASELANQSFYNAYTEQVGNQLTGLGHHLVSGNVTEGIILIKPLAKKRRSTLFDSGYNQKLVAWNQMEQDDVPSSDLRAVNFANATRPMNYVKTTNSKSDDVREVYVEFIGPGGMFMGSTVIYGNKVRPEFVAEVIDRLIREGKW
ncbi:MAG: hypothetical protein AB1746_06945 [Candidatus Zixiibacteriota bacterium]